MAMLRAFLLLLPCGVVAGDPAGVARVEEDMSGTHKFFMLRERPHRVAQRVIRWSACTLQAQIKRWPDFELPAGSGSNDALDALEAAKDDEAGGGLVEEWDKHMEGFTPELLLTFPLPGRSDEFFYEDIPENSPPVLIRGGFFASASEALLCSSTFRRFVGFRILHRRLCISRSPRRVNTMAMKLAMILTKAVDDDGDHEDGGDDYSFSDDDAAVEDDDDKLKMIMMMMAMVLVLVRMGVRYCPYG
eukprot:s1326_g7.t1